MKQILGKLDNFQKKHRVIAFGAAVIKKYLDVDGGRQAALITYFGFLSLLPLILVATTIAHFYIIDTTNLAGQISETIDKYFPNLGDYLNSNIQGYNKTGLALLIGLLVTLYGVRGGASALRNSLNNVWDVPERLRLKFPASTANSFLIILVGGGGFLTATVLSSYAAALSSFSVLKVLPFLVSFLILIAVFYLIFSLGVNSREPRRRDLLFSAMAAAVGVQILHMIGGYLLTHQLKNLSSLYGAFAAVLVLLFWIYLQVQILLFAAMASVVRAKKLWPRSLLG